jgi:quercetin dioxygenase-like cupin family protein
MKPDQAPHDELRVVRSFNAHATLAQLPNEGVKLLGSDFGGCYMIGVTRFQSATGIVEWHETHDELLVVLAGRGRITVWAPDGPRHCDVQPGSVVWIPAGQEHAFDVKEEIQLVFVSPARGNGVRATSPGGEAILARHEADIEQQLARDDQQPTRKRAHRAPQHGRVNPAAVTATHAVTNTQQAAK